MILTIDAGNSRIKWALWQQDKIAEQGAVSYERAALMPTLQEALVALSRPAAVYAVCVAGETVTRALSEWVERQWQLPVTFLQTQKRYRHIRHAYPEPSQHGADRWAAVVAAHYLYPESNLCIIGAGTAITFDFIDAGGKHRGGYILPSWNSMHRALTVDTANVVSQIDAGGQQYQESPVLPDNTRDAVNAGLDLLLQAGIRAICHKGLAEITVAPGPEVEKTEDKKALQTDNVKTGIIVSGGFAQTILDWQDLWSGMPEMIHQPDLVMQGLYRIMRQPDTGSAGAGS